MIRLGIIGSNYTLEHIKVISSIKEFEMEGVFSPCWGEYGRLAQQHGVPVYFDLENLLDVADAIIITANENWYPLAVEVVKRSKHLFIDPPFALALKEAENLIKLVHEADVKVRVSHPYSLNPAFLASTPFVQQPLFVEMVNHCICNDVNMHSCLVGQSMIFDLSLLIYIVKSGVKRINATGISGKRNCPDMINARVEFNNGSIANLTASKLALKRKHKYLLYQQDELLTVNFLENESVKYTFDDPKNGHPQKRNIFISSPLTNEMDYTRRELVDFCNFIYHKGSPMVKLEDAYYSLQLAHEIIDKVNRTVLQMADY